MADATPHESRLCVCLILDDEWATAFPIGMRYLQLGLIDAAIDTIVVIPDGRKPPQTVGNAGSTVTYTLGNWLTRRAQRRLLIEQIRARNTLSKSGGAIIAHGFGPQAWTIATELVAGLDGGVALTLDGGESHEPHNISGKREPPTTLLAPSEPIRKRLIARHVGPRVQIVTLGVPSANHPVAFNHDTADATIIFAGRLSHRARVDILLRAMKRVLMTQPEAVLFIAGKGPAEPSLRQLAESLGIAASVIFVGRIDPMRAVMESADIFCVPHWDGRWSEELVEAMAVGLAVVVPENGPCESLVHSRTALLFSGDDEFRVAEHLERLLTDRALARRLATDCQAAARVEHSVSRMVEQHLAVYRELASRDKTLKLDSGR